MKIASSAMCGFKVLLTGVCLAASAAYADENHADLNQSNVQDSETTPVLTSSTGDAKSPFELAILAKKAVKADLLRFSSVWGVGAGSCGAKWAAEALGLPISLEAPSEDVGVRAYFSDRAEFEGFAKASLVLGSKVTVEGVQVPICAILGEVPVAQPVASGSTN